MSTLVNLTSVNFTKETFEVTRAEIEEAYTQIDAHFIEVMKASAANIRAYHEKQKRNSWFDAKEDGTILGQKITPMHSVGCICSWWKSCISFHYTDERSTCQGCRCSQYYHDYPAGADGKINAATPGCS